VSKLGVFVFVTAFFTLESYIFLVSRGSIVPDFIFWVGVSAMLGVFLAQAYSFIRTPPWILKIEMLVIILAFSYLYIALTPSFVLGYDSNFTVGSSAAIFEKGWPLDQTVYSSSVRLLSNWPGLSLLSGSVHSVSGMDWQSMMQLLPPLIYSLVGISTYLLVRKGLGLSDEISVGVGALVPLTYGMAILNGLSNSGLGISLLIFVMYLLCKNRQRRQLRFSFLAAVVITAIVVSHHLTTFYLLLILLFFFAVDLLASRGYRRSISGNAIQETSSVFWVSGPILAYSVVLVFVFWSFVGSIVLELVLRGFLGVVTVQVNSAPTSFFSNPTWAASVLIDGGIAVCCAVIILRNHRDKATRVDKGWPMFLFASTLLGTVILGGRIRGAITEFARGTGLAYGFLLASFHYSYGAHYRRAGAIAILTLLLMLTYGVNQVNRMDTQWGLVHPWEKPAYSNKDAQGGFIRNQELEAVLWLRTDRPVIGDQIVYSLAAWNNLDVRIIPEFYEGNISSAGSADWFIFRDVNLEFVFCPYQSHDNFGISPATLEFLNESASKVFDDGGSEIFRIADD